MARQFDVAELVKRRITEEVVGGGVMTIRLVIERRGLEIDESTC